MADVRENTLQLPSPRARHVWKNPDQSRQIILNGLKSIRKAKDINPNAILIISFFDAKSKELANIFSNGQLAVRREAYDVITQMDPSNQTAYAKSLRINCILTGSKLLSGHAKTTYPAEYFWQIQSERLDLPAKINIVLTDNTNAAGWTSQIFRDQLNLRNMRGQKLTVAIADIYEIIIDINDWCWSISP